MIQPEDYKKEKLTIDLVWANVFGVLLVIPTAFIFGLPYYFIWRNNISDKSFFHIMENISSEFFAVGASVLFITMITGIVVHELIHGIIWARYASNGFKSIRFGFLWKMLTPYCHCKEPLFVRHYIYGAIMPAIILGFIPAIVSIVIGSPGMLAFGIFFTIAAGGDFLIIHLLRKESMDDLVEDHPSEAGCYIYRRIKEE